VDDEDEDDCWTGVEGGEDDDDDGGEIREAKGEKGAKVEDS